MVSWVAALQMVALLLSSEAAASSGSLWAPATIAPTAGVVRWRAGAGIVTFDSTAATTPIHFASRSGDRLSTSFDGRRRPLHTRLWVTADDLASEPNGDGGAGQGSTSEGKGGSQSSSDGDSEAGRRANSGAADDASEGAGVFGAGGRSGGVDDGGAAELSANRVAALEAQAMRVGLGVFKFLILL